MVKYNKSIEEASIIFNNLMRALRNECQLEELGMTAHKYYKRDLVTAEQFDGSEEMAKRLDLAIGGSGQFWLQVADGMPLKVVRGDWILPRRQLVHDANFRYLYALLPVIPQAVGEYIEDAKASHYEMLDAMTKWTLDQPVFDWIHDNSDTFALAWLLGEWEVEE